MFKEAKCSNQCAENEEDHKEATDGADADDVAVADRGHCYQTTTTLRLLLRRLLRLLLLLLL